MSVMTPQQQHEMMMKYVHNRNPVELYSHEQALHNVKRQNNQRMLMAGGVAAGAGIMGLRAKGNAQLLWFAVAAWQGFALFEFSKVDYNQVSAELTKQGFKKASER